MARMDREDRDRLAQGGRQEPAGDRRSYAGSGSSEWSREQAEGAGGGRVPPGARREDDAIRAELVRRLEAEEPLGEALAAGRVRISVEAGRVRFEGEVRERRFRDAAVEAAQEIPGVHGIRDDLRVAAR